MNSTLTATDKYSIRTALEFFIGACAWDVLEADLLSALPHEAAALRRTFQLAYGAEFCTTQEIADYLSAHMR